MPNPIEELKHPEKQNTSSSGEKQPSPSDFAAGKRHQGILKRKSEAIQDREDGKKKEVTFRRAKYRKIIDSSQDKDIKIDYKCENTILSEHLKIFADTSKNCIATFKDLKKLLDPKYIYNHCDIDLDNFQQMYNNFIKVHNWYKNGKNPIAEGSLKLCADLIANHVEKLLVMYDKLQNLKREVEQSRQH